MPDDGGLEFGMPGEGGGGGVPEELSEEARQRFAASAAAMQQIRREEKKAKKRDDALAQAIIQFLGDQSNPRLFLLISRLVARDCPSIFILAILSLVHEGSRTVVQEYLKDLGYVLAEDTIDDSMALVPDGSLDARTSHHMVHWIARMQQTLSIQPEEILKTLMIDEKNIDGTVLQLTTFVVKEFLESQKRSAEFEKIQPLTASILQTVFEPFVTRVRKKILEG